MAAIADGSKTDRLRRLEMLVCMEERDITFTATAKYLGWTFSTTRYNLLFGSEPERRAALLKLGFPEELLPPVVRKGRPPVRIPRFPGVPQNAAPDPSEQTPDMVSA